MVMMLDVSFIAETFDRNAIDQAVRVLLYNQVANSIISVTRDIDIKGWHKTGKTIGVLFTEISAESNALIFEKIKQSLFLNMHREHAAHVSGSPVTGTLLRVKIP